MDGIVTNALCVRSVDYLDSKTLLTLCTIEKGKINAVIRGAKSEKSKLRFAASLLCFGEYVLAERGGYYTVTNCALTEGFYEVRKDLPRLYSAFAVAELLDKLTVEHADISEYVYEGLDALKGIAYKTDPLLSLLKFLVKALEFSGFPLSLKKCMTCGAPVYRGYIDVSRGGGVCLKCQSLESDAVDPATYGLLYALTYGTEIPNGVGERHFFEGIHIVYKFISAYADVKINSVSQLIKLLAT
ncbi:MAG: DNA repair protein RecO [Clostridiales bacterium]|jgi:DNA repair protein RecO (recombination protein O)|nr:DNA repair protein RecO [Clostridiales bacterium]